MAQSSLPPSKKRRLQLQPQAFKMKFEESSQPLACLLYFDTLPDATICNIVRFLSLIPRAKKFASYIYLCDIWGLYSVKGQLATFMHSLCTALRLEKKLSNISSSSLEDEEEEAIRCEPQELHDLSLPKSFTDSIDTLDVRYDAQSEHFELFSVMFPNIRNLRADVDLYSEELWVEGDTSSIDSHITDTFPTTIAKCFPNLLHLYLNDIHWYGWNEESWENVGEKLETFSVRDTVYTEDVIEFALKFCKNIKRLEVSGVNVAVKKAIVKCIVSYKTQLKHVRLYMLREEQLTRVMKACPEARIDLRTSEIQLEQSLKIVGKQLESVLVYAVAGSRRNERGMVDWAACEALGKATFYFNVTVADIQRFLKSAKYHLKAFELSMDCELKKVHAAVSLIAKRTGGLEELTFTCNDAPLGTFKELVAANRSLRKVSITLIKSARDKEVAIDIVKTFMKASSLRYLVVCSDKDGVELPEIEDICRLQGCRRIWVTVFGVVYLH